MRDRVQDLVEAEGLCFLGIVGLDCGEDYIRFQRWLSEAKQAGMHYLARFGDCRRDPSNLLPSARSAIIIALPYACGDRWNNGSHSPRVAQYARYHDYHKILWKKGEAIAKRFKSLEPAIACRVAVDSAPLLERALAAKTAEGFVGKNTLYIHPREGSFLLLGEILTTASLPHDTPAAIALDRKTKSGGCGPCRLCQQQCPTGALDEAYVLDANRCLSYWTIEHRGTIPEKFWPWLGKYYFGCDICQLVCPYNHPDRSAQRPAFLEERPLPSLFETAVMDSSQYEKYFGGTPLTRAKRGGLRRNALIAMAVTKDPKLDEALEAARFDPESPVGETAAQIERWLGH